MAKIVRPAWETIDNDTSRLKVPHGWIVRTIVGSGSYQGGVSVHQIFIANEAHSWENPLKIEEVP